MAIICTIQSSGEVICIRPPAPSCVPPLLWRTSRCECLDGSLPSWGSGTPICVAPPPPPPAVIIPPCTLTITYTAAAPSAPLLTAPHAGCDAAGLELALAVALARLLGAP